ncbi:uncharacterized protein LOC115821585 [Chanos chanos]|uniref:Uncharacterized protein LOC115821585 n=1 Tax=Chanos chanos TaxID=29144 RepID=A0A6J2WD07_CHACN|nr:uncharacterized protein LOC115821585 [Chanos chanos]
MASELVKKTQSITTAKDMRESTQLIMKPYANWEEYLTPAPLSIAILGELVFISSSTDFSINKNPPKDGYKHIKYPESFRACLMQVCNSGWWAFNEAHKNMDQIRLHTSTVPAYMKTAVKILFQGSDEVVQALLPDQLENIRVIADDCVQLACAAEQKFTDVINIIQELLEACVNAEHFYGEELNEIKRKLEEAKMREQTSREANERSKKAMKTMEKELADAQEKYSKAIDSLPSGWEMIGMDFVEGIIESATSLTNGLMSVTTCPDSQMCQASTMKDTCDNTGVKDDAADEVDKINIISKSGEILRAAEILGKFIKGEDIKWKKLYDQKKKKTNTDFAAEQFKRIQSDLQRSPDCAPKQEALRLCETGINICQQLAEYAPEGQCSKEKTAEIICDWKALIKSARAFDSKSKNATKSPSMTSKPPMMYQQENKTEGSGKKSASQRATENAHFRIEQTRAQLDKTRETYEKCVENMEKNQKELTDILITMRKCEVKEIDFNTTIEMLVKGMDAMGRVKEQWEKMVRFFQMVSNIVKVSLNKTLHNFVTTSEKTQKLSYNAKLFSKDQLYNQAFQASNIASLVHMISETYTEVSTKYLMDRVSSLGKLMAMDKSKPEFEQERRQLQNGCDEAQKGILQLVIKNKKAFESSADARLEKIEGELLAILPAAAPEETKAIKEAVVAGMTEEEESNYC